MYAEAVCVENGRIQAVGTLDDVMQYKTDGDEMVDLQGKTMLPGFLDAHSHFVGAANAMTQCDLSECGKFFREDCRCHENVCRKKKFIQRCMDRRL